jgi:hypothetical protein
MKSAIDTAIAVFTATTLAVVTVKGDDLGKAQYQTLKDIQTNLNQKR